MGSVYKKTVTKRLPPNVEFFERKGQRFARWKDAKGKLKTAPVTTGRDGSDRIVIISRTYMAKYRDGSRLVQDVSTGCRDEQAARAVLAQLMKRAENVKSGIVSAADDAVIDHRETLLETHLTAYLGHLESVNASPVYRANTLRQLKRLAAECGFVKLGDLNAAKMENWLAEQARKKMASRTRNSYRGDLLTFCKWCCEHGRLSSNPFSKLPKADERADRRRQRRSLTEAELVQLLEVARLRPLGEYGRQTLKRDKAHVTGKRGTWNLAQLTFDDLPAAVERARERLQKRPEFIAGLERLGRERAMIYKTLVLTGLRKAELASLTIGQLHLDGDHPFAELHAADEKNRQGSQIPIRDDLAKDLRSWVADKNASQAPASISIDAHNHKRRGSNSTCSRGSNSRLPTANQLPGNTPLFSIPGPLIKVFDLDLQAAGIAKRDERGRTLDVHALRHTFGTMLSRGGVTPRTAQAAMRHSSIDLTMNVYTDPKLLDVHLALDSLPNLPLNGWSSLQRENLKATGTDRSDHLPFAPAFAPTWYNSGANESPAGKNQVQAELVMAGHSHRENAGNTQEYSPAKAIPAGVSEGWLTGLEPATSRSTI
jgi:integrase